MPRAAALPPTSSLTLHDLLLYVEQVLQRGIPGAVWVRAEIASLTDRRHLYLDLVQVGADGREVAKCRATLWARERYALEGKFKRATGAGLSAGLSVLLFVSAEFHPQYGFSLHVLDAAPEYTVGDAALRFNELRATLQRENLLHKNRALPTPQDFTRLLVISPVQAAGLGDFKPELDVLEAAGVLEVQYLQALFQGPGAEASMLRAVAQAADAHAEQPADALVILRGGGASTDLAWLNSEALGGAEAQFPAPVITGIGHARDDTMLDELANVRADTPSKAAAFIVGRVLAAAQETQQAYDAARFGGVTALRAAEAATEREYLAAQRAARIRLAREDAWLQATMRQVLGLSPQRTLARGYVVARSGGEVLSSAAQVARGQVLSLTFQDGEVAVTAQ